MFRNVLLSLVVLSFLCVLVPSSHCETDETIFTYQAKESKTDIRRDYDIALLTIALEKTKEKYGPYKLVPSSAMNAERSIIAVKNGRFPNFFVKFSVTDRRMEEMGYVQFPVDRGIVGYRVFFVSPAAADRLERVNTLDELREFTIGQGLGWVDTEILKHNGFKVITGGSYEGLFEMTALGRIDLFARGTNELLGEFEMHRGIEDLMYDNALALYYPLPRFFFTTKSNTEAIKRIEEGLIAAHKDGSIKELWEKYYGPSLEFVNLKGRKIFQIENPFLKKLDSAYKEYIYIP